MQQTSSKQIQDWHWLVENLDSLSIVQEIKIWLYDRIVYELDQNLS